MLTWSANCVIVEVNRVAAFTVKDTKPYVSVVTLTTKTIRFIKTRFYKNN